MDLIEIVVRHWKLIVAVTCTTMLCAGVITLLLPHWYQSEMEFLVNTERTDLTISPDTGQTQIAPSEVTETQLNSEIELLKSTDILQGVVLDYKLYAPFQGHADAPPTPRSLEHGLLKLDRSLSVSPLRKTDIIVVTYRSRNPDRAVAVLDDLKRRYLAAHLVAHGAPGSERFFSTQVSEYKQKLQQAEDALAQFHERTQIYSFPQQQAALVDRLERATSHVQEVDSQISADKARLQESGVQLADVPARTVTQVKQVSDQMALQQLEPALVALENRRIQLVTKFKPTDRLVTEVDEQIANTRQQISQIREERLAEQTTDVNPLHQSIKTDSAKDQVDISGLVAERANAEHDLSLTLGALGAMDKESVDLSTLEQSVKQAQDNYQLYAQRLEEVRLAEALDRDKLSNVVLIESPMVSPIAVSPNLELNLAVGFAAGLGLALILAFLVEMRRFSMPSVWPGPPASAYGEGHLEAVGTD